MPRRVAAITGASSGFGLLTSVSLLKEGMTVIALVRNTERAAMLVKAAAGWEDNLILHKLDVTDAADISSFQSLLEKIGEIDLLVNNAGFAAGGFCEDVSVDEYREQFETNFFGLISITQIVLPFMRQQRSGKILNISSISGLTGFPGLSPYVASKHAVEGYSECLRLEMKPYGVQVALIEPGSYRTSIWSRGRKMAAKSGKDSPYSEYMKKVEREMEVSAKDHGDPQEVADLITALANQHTISKLRHPAGKGIRQMLWAKKLLPWKIWEHMFLSRLR
ncbi:SDR family oxidoreductase [Bacillus lacus]|uniref:SDR family oxidoreductase n=1 Tax=Metabacillus lacus TaxID=1983721 RepID=A0A7X2IYM1_9BACI|nr:SDR family oxidoreductase [Metabacillus lacus]MRX72044.1 SDR family oxidoreductase [Metabacillus lacus]